MPFPFAPIVVGPFQVLVFGIHFEIEFFRKDFRFVVSEQICVVDSDFRDIAHLNCLRNFRLADSKWRRSSMPYFIITRRSMPMPQANPVYLAGSMPPSFKTLGWIMPQPSNSIQP